MYCLRNTSSGKKHRASEKQPILENDRSVYSMNALKPSGAKCLVTPCLSEPKFDIDGRSDYGDYGVSGPPGNRHFIPRKAKLKSAGGRSISLYEKWRLMQYQSNCVMKKFFDKHHVNVSVLPPCVNYDLWKYPKWKALYSKPLDEDPCPDCDVRFSSDSEGIYTPKIAPASILVTSRWNRRPYLDSIILIGLPQHITVAYIKETSQKVFVEYVDPAGPSGDKRGAEEVQIWMRSCFGTQMRKPVKFYQAANGINFQSDKNDVMCQTWIWYWVYFRLVRKVNSEVLARHVHRLGVEKISLERIHRFNCWLSELHKLGFYTIETPSQTKVAIHNTPQRPTPLARVLKKPSMMQIALQKIIKKTSDTCFSRSYAADDNSSSEEDEEEVSEEKSETLFINRECQESLRRAPRIKRSNSTRTNFRPASVIQYHNNMTPAVRC